MLLAVFLSSVCPESWHVFTNMQFLQNTKCDKCVTLREVKAYFIFKRQPNWLLSISVECSKAGQQLPCMESHLYQGTILQKWF